MFHLRLIVEHSPLKPVGRINEMKVKSFGSINKSAILVEKNLKSLGLSEEFS